MWTAVGAVATYDRPSMVGEFLHLGDGVAVEERRALAESLLRALRVDLAGIDVEVRTTLVGVELLEGVDEVVLPFGRLVPGDGRAFQVTPADSPKTRPPAAVFVYETRSAAQLGFQRPPADGESPAVREHEERVGRVLLSLALAGDGPVQEHLTMRSVRFSASAHGDQVPPVSPLVSPAPYRISPQGAGGVVAAAERVARLDTAGLTVPARLLLRARGERARPADQLVDLHTAIEALGGPQNGRRRDLVAALATTAEEATALDRRRAALSRARGDILHRGRVAPNLEPLVNDARSLVVGGIEAELTRQEGRARPRPALSSLYVGAHAHVADWDPRRFDARISSPVSSQALAVSVWGTLAVARGRTRVLQEILEVAGFPDLALSQPALECEVVDRGAVLNELGFGTPTSLDAVLDWPGGVLSIESKFTERSFGVCSQPVKGHCSGDHAIGSDRKTGTAAPCRLTVYDGSRTPRLYWTVGAQLFRPEVLAVPRSPCPFAGANFQLMRNLAFAAAAAAQQRRRWFGFLVAYVAGAAGSQGLERELDTFRALLLDEVADRVRAVSYETIAHLLRGRGEGELADEIARRITG